MSPRRSLPHVHSVSRAPYDPPMLEHCEHCQDYAPAWDHPDYAAWYIALSEAGDYLGAICPGCFAGHDLAFTGQVVAAPPARKPARRPARALAAV